MCFTATASFVASGGLAAVGVASLRASTPKERIVAVVPIAFAVQQALEGVQWLALDKSMTCSAAGYGFLSFAYVLWPIYIPAVVYALDRAGRPAIRWFLGMGIVTALWNVWHLFTQTLSITVFEGHIVYHLGIFLGKQEAFFYVAAVSGALLVSHNRAFFRAGIVIFVSAVLAALLARPAFPSVWCFFAAVTSILVYLYVSRRRKS